MILHEIDKFEIDHKDRDVKEDEVVQNIDKRIKYLTSRIEGIDISMKNKNLVHAIFYIYELVLKG